MLTTEELIEATGGELLSENAHSFSGVSIDSRTVSQGEIFFALRGQRYDGHGFLHDALIKGDGAVVDSKEHLLTETLNVPGRKAVICVRDTLRALQDLAHFLRTRKKITVIAITGSNGKTITKEMTYRILSGRFRVLKNEGNLNNHIGLPLSLTRLDTSDEIVVLELGMNSPGEIKRLCEIAVPTHGVITNLSSAHIGGFGDLDSIRSAKLEILHGLDVAVLNADDIFLMKGVKSFDGRIIQFSIHNDSSVKAEDIVVTESGSNFTLKLNSGETIEIALHVHGLFNVYNALAASAVCISLGITLDEIKTALEGYTAFPMRFEVIRGESITLINDSYNANPSSVEEALKELVRMKGKGRAVAVLGDMLELGNHSEKAHRAVGKMITDMGVDVFIALGEMMNIAAEHCRNSGIQTSAGGSQLMTYRFKDADEVVHGIFRIIRRGDVVLIKGSRLMGMEKIVKTIRG